MENKKCGIMSVNVTLFMAKRRFNKFQNYYTGESIVFASEILLGQRLNGLTEWKSCFFSESLQRFVNKTFAVT